jgi:hypothetical protein
MLRFSRPFGPSMSRRHETSDPIATSRHLTVHRELSCKSCQIRLTVHGRSGISRPEISCIEDENYLIGSSRGPCHLSRLSPTAKWSAGQRKKVASADRRPITTPPHLESRVVQYTICLWPEDRVHPVPENLLPVPSVYLDLRYFVTPHTWHSKAISIVLARCMLRLTSRKEL